jgi:hypothetical protein
MQLIITGDATYVYGFDVDRNRLARPSAVNVSHQHGKTLA